MCDSLYMKMQHKIRGIMLMRIIQKSLMINRWEGTEMLMTIAMISQFIKSRVMVLGISCMKIHLLLLCIR